MEFAYWHDEYGEQFDIEVRGLGLAFFRMQLSTKSLDYWLHGHSIDMITAGGLQLDWTDSWHIRSVVNDDSRAVAYISYYHNPRQIEMGLRSNHGYTSTVTFEVDEDVVAKVNVFVDELMNAIKNN